MSKEWPEPGSGGERKHRRRWLGIALALLLVLLAALIARFDSRQDPAPPADTPQAAPVVSVPASPERASPAGRSAQADDEAAPVPTLPEDDPIALYHQQTRYAPGSGVLSENALDLLEPNRRYEGFVPVGDTVGRESEEEVRFLFTADKYYYEGDERVRARLEVRRSGEAVSVDVLRAQVVAEGGSGPVGDPVELSFERKGDGYLAKVDLAEEFAEHHGPLHLRVRFGYAPGETQDADLRVFTTPVGGIPGRFLDRYRDVSRGGSLYVEAAVEIFDAGFYRFDANLFARDGRPLAFANFKGNLAAGVQWVPLEFFGLLLIDLGVSGPYELRNLRGYRFLDGHYPDRLRLRDATSTYWTHEYDLTSFSEDEYTSPEKQRVLDLLEQDRRGGIAVDMPEAAQGP